MFRPSRSWWWVACFKSNFNTAYCRSKKCTHSICIFPSSPSMVGNIVSRGWVVTWTLLNMKWKWLPPNRLMIYCFAWAFVGWFHTMIVARHNGNTKWPWCRRAGLCYSLIQCWKWNGPLWTCIDLWDLSCRNGRHHSSRHFDNYVHIGGVTWNVINDCVESTTQTRDGICERWSTSSRSDLIRRSII